jgi:uncharacterized membrane protein (DUF4010 family)
MPEVPLTLMWRLAVAALGGLAVGIEREWSVKRGRHVPHFAGTRTFLLLGLLGALGAHFITTGLAAAGASLIIAAALLVVVAYAITSKKEDVGGTTEVAALIVLAAGAVAGTGQLTLASALFALTTLVLVEKSRFHTFVARIRSYELMAAVRFGVLALVVFPLLPPGPIGPPPGLHPQELWALVLLFSGLSFLSYLVLRMIGLQRGYGVAGLLGGLMSSTAVTLHFSRDSRQQPALGPLLATGVIAACTTLPARVVLLTAALNPHLALYALPYLVPPCLGGLLVIGLALCRRSRTSPRANLPRNPLRLAAAMTMAGAFQLVLWLTGWLTQQLGTSGLLVSAGLAGLTDVDAVIYSMYKLGTADALVATAAKALAVAVLANTLFKAGLALVVGRGVYRAAVIGGFAVLILSSLAPLLLLP